MKEKAKARHHVNVSSFVFLWPLSFFWTSLAVRPLLIRVQQFAAFIGRQVIIMDILKLVLNIYYKANYLFTAFKHGNTALTIRIKIIHSESFYEPSDSWSQKWAGFRSKGKFSFRSPCSSILQIHCYAYTHQATAFSVYYRWRTQLTLALFLALP